MYKILIFIAILFIFVSTIYFIVLPLIKGESVSFNMKRQFILDKKQKIAEQKKLKEMINNKE